MNRIRFYVGRFLMQLGMFITPPEAKAHIGWNTRFLNDAQK